MTLDLNSLFALASVGIVGVALGVWVWVRHRATRNAVDRFDEAVATGRHLPPSLHPVVDPNLCLGSLSCIKACPEGDILGLVDGKAKLVEPTRCIGHGKCESECPVDAITLVFGTKEVGQELPDTDESYETSRKGVFVVGELGGMGLIQNALNQGLDCVRRLPPAAQDNDDGTVDVAIVGAGPAGLAAALACVEAGRSYVLLEQGNVGGAVQHFPRGKVVMTAPTRLPLVGKFGAKVMTKEKLLDALNGVVEHAGLSVNEGERVTGVDGKQGAFTVTTSLAEHRARHVVLALGLSGNPRRLGCAGEDLEKVSYRLSDPDAFAGQRVLVVGGGDSAVEATLQLARETDAEVALSYRKPTLSRCRPELAGQVTALVEDGRIRFLSSTTVECIEANKVRLQDAEDPVKKTDVENDAVIICIGGERPTAFLETLGVDCRLYRGEPRRQTAGAAPAERTSLMPSGVSLAVFGCAVLLGLFYVGEDYYTLPIADREGHELHEFLRPSGLWGHGVGIVATLFMASNFLYSLRKRLGIFKGLARIRPWLTFHMFVGVMSPVVIAFHAAFQAKNGLAVTTWVGLAVVVGTGVFGRYLYARLPSSEDGVAAAGVRRVFRLWLGVHIALASLLVLLVVGHIGLSLYLGYQWIF